MARLSREVIRNLVDAYTPRGWTVKESKFRSRGGSGAAVPEGKLLQVPELVNRHALYVFFHEVGHVVLGHMRGGVERHLEECQAEIYAIETSKRHGIGVPRSELERARQNVKANVLRDAKAGVMITPGVLLWLWKPLKHEILDGSRA